MPLDPSRFLYSLAGRLLAEEWTLEQLKQGIGGALEAYRRRVPKLAERIFSAFTAKPSYKELVWFLREDRGVRRALWRSPGASQRAFLRAQLRELTQSSAQSARRSRSVGSRAAVQDLPPVRLRGAALPRLTSEADVARFFGILPRRLCWLADVSGRNRKHPPGPLRPYRHRWIPRPGRFPRLLEIPKVNLKRMQRRILAVILDAVPVHPAVHGFCTGRSIVSNAAEHCGKQTILRFDLADFFPSVTSARVFQIFRTIGYSPNVARVLTGICTTQIPPDVWDDRPGDRKGADFQSRQKLITRHLPQGAPTSPALANLAAHRMDRRLSALARAAGVVYTRYADDLTFSGGPSLARARKRFADYVALIVAEEGFALNFRKTRILRAGTRQHVTGVVVNAHPNIARPEFDRLKAILTNCLRHGPASQNRAAVPDFRAHLAGKLSHIADINPARGEKLRRIFQKIDWMGS